MLALSMRGSVSEMHPLHAYKITTPAAWLSAEHDGVLGWHGIDAEDGYMHLSTGAQLAQTLSLHFRNQGELVLVELALQFLPDPDRLVWEPSRGGDLFPHLYAALPLSAVSRVWHLSQGSDGSYSLPEGV